MLSDNNVQLLPSSEVNFESYQPEGGWKKKLSEQFQNVIGHFSDLVQALQLKVMWLN
jgi:hypothetical protein